MALSGASSFLDMPSEGDYQRQFVYHKAQSSDPDNLKPEDSLYLEQQKSEAAPMPSQTFEASSFITTWAWELISLVASVLCLIAMLVLLLVYRNKSVPELSLGLTVSAQRSVDPS